MTDAEAIAEYRRLIEEHREASDALLAAKLRQIRIRRRLRDLEVVVQVPVSVEADGAEA